MQTGGKGICCDGCCHWMEWAVSSGSLSCVWWVSAAKHSGLGGTGELPALYTEGFDLTQVWEQVECLNRPMISFAQRRLRNFERSVLTLGSVSGSGNPSQQAAKKEQQQHSKGGERRLNEEQSDSDSDGVDDEEEEAERMPDRCVPFVCASFCVLSGA